MIERRPFLDVLTHLVLILGVVVVAFRSTWSSSRPR